MLANEKGFTLIELIIVIVILGILSAVAIPKYQDLRGDAAAAAANGVFGSAEGACAVNFASRLVSPTRATLIDTAGNLVIAMDGLPSNWSATGLTFTDGTYSFTLAPVVPAVQTVPPTRRAKVSKVGTW